MSLIVLGFWAVAKQQQQHANVKLVRQNLPLWVASLCVTIWCCAQEKQVQEQQNEADKAEQESALELQEMAAEAELKRKEMEAVAKKRAELAEKRANQELLERQAKLEEEELDLAERVVELKLAAKKRAERKKGARLLPLADARTAGLRPFSHR